MVFFLVRLALGSASQHSRSDNSEGSEEDERPEIFIVTPGELQACRCSMYKRLPALFISDEEHARAAESASSPSRIIIVRKNFSGLGWRARVVVRNSGGFCWCTSSLEMLFSGRGPRATPLHYCDGESLDAARGRGFGSGDAQSLLALSRGSVCGCHVCRSHEKTCM